MEELVMGGGENRSTEAERSLCDRNSLDMEKVVR
jgi:hypothetical protein